MPAACCLHLCRMRLCGSLPCCPLPVIRCAVACGYAACCLSPVVCSTRHSVGCMLRCARTPGFARAARVTSTTSSRPACGSGSGCPPAARVSTAKRVSFAATAPAVPGPTSTQLAAHTCARTERAVAGVRSDCRHARLPRADRVDGLGWCVVRAAATAQRAVRRPLGRLGGHVSRQGGSPSPGEDVAGVRSVLVQMWQGEPWAGWRPPLAQRSCPRRVSSPSRLPLPQ